MFFRQIELLSELPDMNVHGTCLAHKVHAPYAVAAIAPRDSAMFLFLASITSRSNSIGLSIISSPALRTERSSRLISRLAADKTCCSLPPTLQHLFNAHQQLEYLKRLDDIILRTVPQALNLSNPDQPLRSE